MKVTTPFGCTVICPPVIEIGVPAVYAAPLIAVTTGVPSKLSAPLVSLRPEMTLKETTVSSLVTTTSFTMSVTGVTVMARLSVSVSDPSLVVIWKIVVPL